MSAAQISDDEIIDRVRQLPPAKQSQLLRVLITASWPEWAAGADYGEARAREAAKRRGLDWSLMREADREVFIDDVLHENGGA